jgi:hypothetical protein
MKTIKAFIKRHPLLSYFALTFAISWGGERELLHTLRSALV